MISANPWLYIIVSALLMVPASGMPVTPNEQVNLPVLLDSASPTSLEERKIGDRIMRHLRREAPLHTDPLVRSYTEFLLYRLASASQLQMSDRQLSLFVIDNPTLNAFAAPGGVVAINLGLFTHADTEHEFASILAHELAHLSQRHYARNVDQNKRLTLPYLASIFASAFLISQGNADAGLASLTASQAALTSRRLNYSRSIEQEADRIGIQTMARAGLDPEAMSGMFLRLSRANRFNQKLPEFLLTHPVTENRIADARGQAARYPKKKHASSVDFGLMKSRVELFHESPEDARETYQASLARNPESEVLRYRLALALSKDLAHDEAIAMITKLVEKHPDRLAYLLTRAEILITANQAWRALPILEEYIRINPDNHPAAMIHARALAQEKRFKEAQRVLEHQVRLRPDDIQVKIELAEISGLSADIITVHRTRAEVFQLRGDFDEALAQLEYALRKVGKEDHRTLAQISQRIEEIKELAEKSS